MLASSVHPWEIRVSLVPHQKTRKMHSVGEPRPPDSQTCKQRCNVRNNESDNRYPPVPRAVLVLAGIIALCVLGALSLSKPHLRASSLPALTFQSPIGNPQLALEKTVDNNAPEPGDEIAYTLTYSSTRPGSQAFNVRLYDFLPAGVQFLSANPPQASYEDGMLLFTDPSVGPTNESVTVSVRVPWGYPYLYNHALVAADGITPTHDSLLTSVEISSSLASLLRVVKTGREVTLVSDVLVYTLRCESIAGAPVNQVKVVDVLPTGSSLVSAYPPPDAVSLPLLEWSVGKVEPDQPWTAIITATTVTAHVGVITNTALANGQQAIMTQTLFATHVVTAILHVTQTQSAPSVKVSDHLVYTLTYYHEGDQQLAWAMLTDTLPSDVAVIGANPQPDTLTPGWGVWRFGALDPGERRTIVITVTVGGSPNRTLHNIVDLTGPPNTWPDHSELSTQVKMSLYLPLVLKQYP